MLMKTEVSRGQMFLKSTKNQSGLPRYFNQVFDQVKNMNTGRLDFVLPDGRIFRAEGKKSGPYAKLKINDDDIFARLIREGDLGFSDAYLDDGWSTPDLQAFMDWAHTDNEGLYDGFPGMSLLRAYEKIRFWLQSNSKRQALKNISHHYDLGNEFYGLWLDNTMTYSSALFETGQESLEQAQIAKYASMIDQMGVSSGDHVLEIGCGWGGFAEYAAKERGLRVTGLTISKEQLDFSRKRIKNRGLDDKVVFKLQDYRDEKGTYDGIASIEMFEAVGEKYWPIYFQILRNCLRPGRKATLQIITVSDERWDIYRRGIDYIQKYIFPGGMLPCPSVLRTEMEKADLEVVKSVQFGQSYSKTLRLWYDDFNRTWEQAAALGFDDRFKRMWNFYLTSCASTFSSGNCDVAQITVSNTAKS